MNQFPDVAARNPDGSYGVPEANDFNTSYSNPIFEANMKENRTNNYQLDYNVFANIKPIKGLNIRIEYGGNRGWGNSYYFIPDYSYGNIKVESQSTRTKTLSKYSSFKQYATYDFDPFKHNHFQIMLGHEAQWGNWESLSGSRKGYISDSLHSLGIGDASTATNSGDDGTPWAIESYFGRLNYNLLERYLLTATLRTDGSSSFGKNNRWGYFPSASAAWRISDEKFFKNIKELSFVNDMKIRASYGVTGNFEIGNYDHLATMSTDNYILGTNGGLLHYGYKPDNIKRDDLSWEKNQMINAGIDLQMFDGYIGFSVDYYNTNTSNMLLYVPVPLLTGYSTSLQNLGKVNNRGWELALTSQHTFANGFGYSFNANYAKNTNEVKELGPGNAPIISSGSVGHAYYITEVGKPIGNYYLLVQDGIFATEEDLKKYPHFDNTEVGDFRFVDVDGDGKLDLDKDRTICGNYMPKFTYGFGGKLWYAGFDMDFNFQGVYGNKILNLNKRYLDNMEGNTNGTKIALDRWKSPENPGSGSVNKANRKQTGYNSRTSTWHLESGSYLRLQNLSLGYTLPRALTQKFKVEKMRVYVSGQNLFTITNYSGYNPEVNARPSKNLTPGEDYGTYPLARTYMFGLNLTL